MLNRLGQWLGRARPADIQDRLRALAGFARLPPNRLAELAAGSVYHAADPGLLEPPGDAARGLYLQRGSVQVQTGSGYVLTLDSNSVRARYPLPPLAVSIYATEPVVLLSVPARVDNPRSGPAPAPTMSDAEATALERLAGEIRDGRFDLPSLPDLAMRIGRKIDDAGNNNRDIARMIQLDPALTARLLGIVNSAALAGVRRIRTVNGATTRLGRARLRSLVYSCLVKSLFKINSPALERRLEAIWRRSVSVAALAFVLGRETEGIDPEQAMLAGLTHMIGAVAVMGSLRRHAALSERSEVIDHVIETLRVPAGLAAVERWNLDAELAPVIRDAGHWSRIGTAIPETVDIVNLAMLHDAIGKNPRTVLPRIDRVPAYDKLKHGQLSPRRSLQLLDEAEAEVDELRGLLSQDRGSGAGKA
jgi:HD-like signal output (HDOD) protein